LEKTSLTTDKHGYHETVEGGARHFRRRLAMAGQAVRAVVGVSRAAGRGLLALPFLVLSAIK
jgi:hypothetical protein